MTGPTSKPTQTHSLSRRGWTATAVLVLLAALLTQTGPFSRDIFDEGRDVTLAVVALGESILDEFASDHAAGAVLGVPGPQPCEISPPWSPNRVTFSGGLRASLPQGTDSEAVLDFAEAYATTLGLAVRGRTPGRLIQSLRLRSARGTDVFVEVLGNTNVTVSIHYSSRCLPRPRGYRGGGYEQRQSLINDWPTRIGFQSGGLSRARLF